jgi:hypothetical protein
MAIIPIGQKFHTIASNVQTVERGSSLVNAQKNIYGGFLSLLKN